MILKSYVIKNINIFSMKNKGFNYKSLAKVELEFLKDLYIKKKVKDMSNIQLREFVTESITLQIKNTIGNEEELEAWEEMKSFFQDEFEFIIREIQQKFKSLKDCNEKDDYQASKRLELVESSEDEKEDMW